MHEEIYTIVLKSGEQVTAEESFESKSDARAYLRKQVKRSVRSWKRVNPTLYVCEERDTKLQVQENNLYREDPRKETRW